ncbi:hypothetical protein FH972_022548 [Carpinus fangiana]|uniref:Uncharacterized protein n=1 Tax=Carpinus fangiana TaxID=176857 RepID=A0A5N6KSW2_9ROSI|nr:hypothetical protein FH972_022548 [Carpinus fangiana]
MVPCEIALPPVYISRSPPVSRHILFASNSSKRRSSNKIISHFSSRQEYERHSNYLLGTMTYTLVEPHPSATSRKVNAAGNVTMGFSRGGAGNYAAYSRTSLTEGATASGPAARSTIIRPTARPFVGIGGAGNARPNEACHSYSIEEELERLRASTEARQKNAQREQVFHVGRGGAGNAYRDSKSRQSSTSSSASSSSSTSQSSIRRAAGRLSRALSRE